MQQQEQDQPQQQQQQQHPPLKRREEELASLSPTTKLRAQNHLEPGPDPYWRIRPEGSDRSLVVQQRNLSPLKVDGVRRVGSGNKGLVMVLKERIMIGVPEGAANSGRSPHLLNPSEKGHILMMGLGIGTGFEEIQSS